MQATQQSNYEAPNLRKWISNLKEKFEYKLHDEDVRYVLTRDPREQSSENKNEVEEHNITKIGAETLSVSHESTETPKNNLIHK